jgi:Family of unknown function (DUF5681)
MTDTEPTNRRILIDSPRGRPFTRGQSGNPAGRPPGARNRATVAAQVLLDGQLEAITQKAAELAVQGDVNAIRLCLQHGLPLRREQPIEFEIRKLEWLSDAQDAIADVIAAVAAGNITLAEAAEVVKLIEAFVRACVAGEQTRLIDQRIMNSR